MVDEHMADERDREQNERKPKKRTRHSIMSLVYMLFLIFCLGFFLLILVSIIQWKTQGFNRMASILNENLKIEISDISLKNAKFTKEAALFLGVFHKKLGRFFIYAKNKGNHIMGASFLGSKIFNIFSKSSVFLKHLVFLLWTVFLILAFKFLNVIGAFLLYLFSILFGALDGLCRRYIRTAEGGRESTFIYHKLSKVILSIPAWLILIYLISPILIRPEIIIILLSVSFFMTFNIWTASLKKFL